MPESGLDFLFLLSLLDSEKARSVPGCEGEGLVLRSGVEWGEEPHVALSRYGRGRYATSILKNCVSEAPAS